MARTFGDRDARGSLCYMAEVWLRLTDNYQDAKKVLDGEAVACDDNGVASFNLVRYRRHDDSSFLYAFDLIEQNGDDLRRDPLEGRKATLEMILAKAGPGIRFNEHIEGDGESVFRHGHCVKAEGLALSLWPFARLAQHGELGCTGREAGGRRRMG